MMGDKTDNPFTLLGVPDDREWPPSADPLSEAISAFDPDAPQALIAILQSNNPRIVRRGLCVFEELGRKGEAVLDAALGAVGHEDSTARFYLVSGVSSLYRQLTSQQLSVLLPLAEDVSELVRGGMIVLLGVVRLDVLREAIEALVDDEQKTKHLQAYSSFSSKRSDYEAVLHEGLLAEPLTSTYLLASIEHAARTGDLQSNITYDGSSYLGESVAAHVERLIKARIRILQRRSSS